MSGGHFNYECFKIDSLAKDIQHEIDINDSNERDSFGDLRGRGLKQETIALIQAAVQEIEAAGAKAKEIEWLYSDDTGEEEFCEAMRRIDGRRHDKPSGHGSL